MEEQSGYPAPPQIFLSLDNLWQYAEGDVRIFREEVRLTYLHEPGHYLGWGEDQPAARGWIETRPDPPRTRKLGNGGGQFVPYSRWAIHPTESLAPAAINIAAIQSLLLTIQHIRY